ncbi:MAG: endonuclease domain-containing protein [Bacteroidaceae bacterium]|nr:endonuclease domain-containing protein [Bacteroidaceae bacterium]
MMRSEEKSYLTADPMNYGLLKELAKKHKDNMTDAESYLWNFICGDSLGVRFRKQHIIDNYIVDFVCLSKQLVIEVDGGYHLNKEQKEQDKIRTNRLKELGFRELRFTNEEVLSDIDTVLETITDALNE